MKLHANAKLSVKGRALAAAHGVDPDRPSADPIAPAALLLARAAAPSPR